MNTNNKIVVFGIIALVVLVFASFVAKSPVVLDIKEVAVAIREVTDAIKNSARNLGAIPGDVVDGIFFSIGGNRRAYKEFPISATSSAICAFQNPFNATSSIVSAGLVITRGVTGDNNFDISTTTNDFKFGSSTPALVYGHLLQSLKQQSVPWRPNGTTTSVGTIGVAAGTPFRGVLPGLTNSGASNYILGPNEWVTWRIATSSAGTFATPFAGTCTIQLEKL